jgi:hypothetical protein
VSHINGGIKRALEGYTVNILSKIIQLIVVPIGVMLIGWIGYNVSDLITRAAVIETKINIITSDVDQLKKFHRIP